MTNSVPQRSVLAPLLLVIYINDLDEDTLGTISKFADNTRIGGIVNEDGHQQLQQVHNLSRCTDEEWLMDLNSHK